MPHTHYWHSKLCRKNVKMREQKLMFSIKDIICLMPRMSLWANMARGRRKALICYINWYPTKEINSLILFQKYLKMVLTAANHELFRKRLCDVFVVCLRGKSYLECAFWCVCVWVCTYVREWYTGKLSTTMNSTLGIQTHGMISVTL